MLLSALFTHSGTAAVDLPGFCHNCLDKAWAVDDDLLYWCKDCAEGKNSGWGIGFKTYYSKALLSRLVPALQHADPLCHMCGINPPWAYEIVPSGEQHLICEGCANAN